MRLASLVAEVLTSDLSDMRKAINAASSHVSPRSSSSIHSSSRSSTASVASQHERIAKEAVKKMRADLRIRHVPDPSIRVAVRHMEMLVLGLTGIRVSWRVSTATSTLTDRIYAGISAAGAARTNTVTSASASRLLGR